MVVAFVVVVVVVVGGVVVGGVVGVQTSPLSWSAVDVEIITASETVVESCTSVDSTVGGNASTPIAY